jgi:hypothetical protein
VETLRRAAEEAGRAADPLVLAEVLTALGSALVHAVRGFDGEGTVVLNRALAAARTAGSQPLTAEILRELAFALACQLGDPCWEGMAGRALALLAAHRTWANASSQLPNRVLATLLIAGRLWASSASSTPADPGPRTAARLRAYSGIPVHCAARSEVSST